jgi:hypothetical protein
MFDGTAKRLTAWTAAAVVLGLPLAAELRGGVSDGPAGPTAPLARPGFCLSPSDAAFSLAAAATEAPPSPEGAGPAPQAPRKNWRRAFLETGVFLAYSTVRYWIEYGEWIEDWQYELTCEDQYRRFLTLEAVRFDSNAFFVNWTHSLAGGLYYLIARANRLTWAESFLMTFGSSAFYEYVGEWREVISVNDMFLTAFGGYSIGEPWHQLAEYFHHRRSPVVKALGFIDPFVKLNAWLDRKDPASKAYAEPGWHAFELSAGWRRLSAPGGTALDTGYVSIETRIVHVPEYGRPGVVRKTLRDTSVSEFFLDLALGGRRPGDETLRPGLDEEANFLTRVVGLASYRQDIDELGRGYALSIGLGSAFSYLRKRPVFYDSRNYQVTVTPAPTPPTDFRDKFAIVHMAGPVVDWTRFSRTFRLRATADAYLDFAMMSAWAFNAYSRVHPTEGLKTTLTYYGYHYAFGASVSGRLEFAWRGLELRGLLSAHVWDSVEGLDRFQDDVVNDANAVDTRVRFLLRAAWKFPAVPLRLFASVEGIHRWGKIAEVTASGRETRTYAGLSFLF